MSPSEVEFKGRTKQRAKGAFVVRFYAGHT